MFHKTICGALRDFGPCTQFKKREKHLWKSVTFSKHPATLLKVTLLHGYISRFLNYTIGTKSRKAPHIESKRKLFCENPADIYLFKVNNGNIRISKCKCL